MTSPYSETAVLTATETAEDDGGDTDKNHGPMAQDRTPRHPQPALRCSSDEHDDAEMKMLSQRDDEHERQHQQRLEFQSANQQLSDRPQEVSRHDERLHGHHRHSIGLTDDRQHDPENEGRGQGDSHQSHDESKPCRGQDHMLQKELGQSQDCKHQQVNDDAQDREECSDDRDVDPASRSDAQQLHAKSSCMAAPGLMRESSEEDFGFASDLPDRPITHPPRLDLQSPTLQPNEEDEGRGNRGRLQVCCDCLQMCLCLTCCCSVRLLNKFLF